MNFNTIPAKSWSFTPYRPIMSDLGDIIVSRIAPYPTHFIFEWMTSDAKKVHLMLRRRGDAAFFNAGVFTDGEGIIDNLASDTDYEFHLTDFTKTDICSKVRLVRTGDYLGTPINYLHPDDTIYDFSGRYLCSPTIVRYQNTLVASMDLFAPGGAQNLTLIFRSDDNGESWHYMCDLFPCFWGKLFIYEDEIYMLACSTEHGDILLSKSTDGGKSFFLPTVLIRGSCHQSVPGPDMSPEPPIIYNGRVWINYHYGSWQVGYHYPCIASAPCGSDLLDINNWTFTPALPYNSQWPGVATGNSNGSLEGTFMIIEDDGTETHGSGLYMLARYGIGSCDPNWGLGLLYHVNSDDPSAPLQYSRVIKFAGNHSKFTVLRDEDSGQFYSIISRIRSAEHRYDRNLLSLVKSSDGINWLLVTDLIDLTDRDPKMNGLQYVDFIFDGNDILYVCRTGVNNPDNYHNTNVALFKRITNFRSL